MSPGRWRRLSHWLDILLDSSAEERARRLARLARREPDLADELRSALGAQRQLAEARFLERSVLHCGASNLQGRQVGPYAVERLLAYGPSAEVWLVRYSGAGAERQVVLKLWSRTLRGLADGRRLASESRQLSRLNHPNIVRVLNGGMWDNRPYLVMECTVGDPIDHWCDARRLPITSRIALFLDVLDAVAHAHTQTVVHGNLKPANILVTASGRVKVLDLGVARLLEHASSGTGAVLSHVARRVFTPVYTAPEQFDGGEVTPAADIYALGVLLHTLLVGAHPGARRLRSLREPPQRVAGEIALLESAPLSASSAALEITHSTAARRGSTPEQLARGLRGGLDRTIAKAVKPRPCERYRTTEAFAKRLRPYGFRPSHGERGSMLGQIMRRLLAPN